MLPGLRSALLGAAPAVPVLFNPSAKAASVTLSNGDKTATFGGTSAGVRSVISAASGSNYIEVTIDNVVANFFVGIANSSVAVTASPAASTNGIAYRNDGAILYNTATVATGAALAAGDALGVHVLFGTGVRFYKNGVAQGTGFSAMPAGGGPFFLHPAQFLSTGSILTINQSPKFSIPSGATYWGQP